MESTQASISDAVYTRDPKRVARLMQNESEGRERERLPYNDRLRLDIVATTADTAHVRNLRASAGLVPTSGGGQ